jgi:hypothetical protein
MSYDYRIEPAGNAFVVIYDDGAELEVYPTEDAAKQHIEH